VEGLLKVHDVLDGGELGLLAEVDLLKTPHARVARHILPLVTTAWSLEGGCAATPRVHGATGVPAPVLEARDVVLVAVDSLEQLALVGLDFAVGLALSSPTSHGVLQVHQLIAQDALALLHHVLLWRVEEHAFATAGLVLTTHASREDLGLGVALGLVGILEGHPHLTLTHHIPLISRGQAHLLLLLRSRPPLIIERTVEEEVGVP